MSQTGPINTDTPSLGSVVASLAGLVAAWISAGSAGLFTQPLQLAVAWTALIVAVVAVWPRGRLAIVASVLFGLMVIAAILPIGPVHGALTAAAVLAILAWSEAGLERRVLLTAALAVTLFGVYRLAYTTIPAVWLAADALGGLLGQLAGAVSGRPLNVGATFGGLDFLVLMAALTAGWLRFTPSPRWQRAALALAAIGLAQLLYLVVLSFSADLVNLLPAALPPPNEEMYNPPAWRLADAIRTLLPWNVPLLAVVIQALVAGAMLRWSAWLPVDEDNDPASVADLSSLSQTAVELGPLALAVLVPLLVILSLTGSSLTDKKIVAYERGYLNWNKPRHDSFGRQSAGMYGMLPQFIESLGGEMVISPELAEADLADADVLMLLHPDEPWPAERLQRVWDFVRRGGSLLVVAGPVVRDDQSRSSFNDVLRPTGMDVRFDVAIAATPNWRHSLTPLSHPATLGLDDRRNRFGMAASSSIETGWSARPLLVGRCGWSDPGSSDPDSNDPDSSAAPTRVSRYEAGQRLGDLVLAAQRQFGQGTVVVLGDTAGFTNLGNVTSFQFTGRLLGYLASRGGSPQDAWRQVLGLAACACLVGLLAWRPDGKRLAAACVLLILSASLCTSAGYHAARVLPDGREQTPNKVAYIDASHLEAYSGVNWSDDGIAGLALTLMRSGYLPLLAPDVSLERIERAGVLFSIGPARPFSAGEQLELDQFVNAGGIFIAMVGAEDVAAVTPLLDHFGMSVPPSPVGPKGATFEPEPMGHLRSTYLNAADYVDSADYTLDAIFHAVWPIEFGDEDVDVLCYGLDDRPVVVSQRAGSGKVVVIGDTCFAMNENLENALGEPIEGRHENSQFWRWALTRLADRKQWIPPKPRPLNAKVPEAPAAPAAPAAPPAVENTNAEPKGATAGLPSSAKQEPRKDTAGQASSGTQTAEDKKTGVPEAPSGAKDKTQKPPKAGSLRYPPARSPKSRFRGMGLPPLKQPAPAKAKSGTKPDKPAGKEVSKGATAGSSSSAKHEPDERTAGQASSGTQSDEPAGKEVSP